METYRILIVEDEKSIAESVQEILECLNHKVVAIADRAEKAMEALRNEDIDLVLLDIQINGKTDGVELAEMIKSKYDVPYIFTTAFADPETLSRAREKGPFGYLVKPYGMKDLVAAIEIAMGNYFKMKQLQNKAKTAASNESHFFVRSDSRLVKLNFEDILFIEARGDYAVFKTENKSYIVHSTMKNLETKLGPRNFLKVHRSFIVNLSKIVDIDDTNLLIKDKIIPVSRNNKEALLTRINVI